MEGIQKRLYQRVEPEENHLIRVKTKMSGESTVLFACNISEAGIALNLDQSNLDQKKGSLNKGDELDLLIELPHPVNEAISVSASIQGVAPKILGLKFLDLPQAQLKILKKYIDHRIEKTDQLVEEKLNDTKEVASDEIRKSKILLVEDNEKIRLLLTRVLQKLHYTNLLLAEHGEVAWNILKKHRDVDLVITDWMMPVLSGLELVKKVRESTYPFASIPIIFSTVIRDEARVKKALKSGINGYLMKPFSMKAIDDQIHNIIQ